MQNFVIRRNWSPFAHQVDVTDIPKGVLTVMELFSRFVWLRLVSMKNSKNIADELWNMYTLRIIQCKQGGELIGAVKRLCPQLGIHNLRERLNIAIGLYGLRWYTALLKWREGVNWAQSLPICQSTNSFGKGLGHGWVRECREFKTYLDT